jgi:hypothetical protein
VGDVRRFEKELLEYVNARHGAMVAGIRQDPKSDVPKDLGDIVTAFKAQFKTSVATAAKPSSNVGEVGEAESAKTLATE